MAIGNNLCMAKSTIYIHTVKSNQIKSQQSRIGFTEIKALLGTPFYGQSKNAIFQHEFLNTLRHHWQKKQFLDDSSISSSNAHKKISTMTLIFVEKAQ